MHLQTWGCQSPVRSTAAARPARVYAVCCGNASACLGSMQRSPRLAESLLLRLQDMQQCRGDLRPAPALLLQRASRGQQRPPHRHHVNTPATAAFSAPHPSWRAAHITQLLGLQRGFPFPVLIASTSASEKPFACAVHGGAVERALYKGFSLRRAAAAWTRSRSRWTWTARRCSATLRSWSSGSWRPTWAARQQRLHSLRLLRAMDAYKQAFLFVDASAPGWRVLFMNDEAMKRTGAGPACTY